MGERGFGQIRGIKRLENMVFQNKFKIGKNVSHENIWKKNISAEITVRASTIKLTFASLFLAQTTYLTKLNEPLEEAK